MKAKLYLTLVSVVLIIIAGLAAYANSLDCQLVWDDMILIKANTVIKSWSNLKEVFFHNLRNSEGKQEIYYRPLQMVSYMLDYSLWGSRVKGYHLSSMALHILVALSVYALARKLSDEQLLPFLGGILFVIHPVHTEAVTYVSGRADPLAALFMLLSFIVYLKLLKAFDIFAFILLPLSYALALLSKEYSLFLPLLLVFYHYAFRKKFQWRLYPPLLLVAAAYLLLRATAIRSGSPGLSPELSPGPLVQRIPGFFLAVFTYLKVIVLPFHLRMEYGNRLFPLNHPGAIAGLVILCLILFYAFRKRRPDQLVFFCLGWLVLGLLPIANLYPVGAYMAEHWLYFPGIGLFLLVARGLAAVGGNRKSRVAGAVITTVLAGFFLARTVQQNDYWREPVKFYERTVKYNPESARLWNNLGIEYQQAGRPEDALAAYRKALKINPGYARSYYNMGSVYLDLDRPTEARAYFEKAIEIEPDYAAAYNNLGYLSYQTGKLAEAMGYYSDAIRKNPHSARAHYNLAMVYQDLNRSLNAVRLYRKAIEIDPDYADAYNKLGNMYYEVGDKETALAFFQKVVELDPSSPGGFNNLGSVLGSLGRHEEALTCFRKALALNPESAEMYANMGFSYALTGQKEEAVAALNQALKIDPAYARAHNHLARVYYDLGEYERAIDHCDRALELGHDVDPEFLKNLTPYRGFKK